MLIRLALALLLLAAPAAAQIAEADRALVLEGAFARLAVAASPEEANATEVEIWALWRLGPTAAATERLAAATATLQRGQADKARRMLDALLADEPDYMEAWNQRAFAKFLSGDLFASLTDIDQVLKREPRHFGALAGRARIEARLGRFDTARKTMGAVGRIHPWMARQSAIPPDPPPPAIRKL